MGDRDGVLGRRAEEQCGGVKLGGGGEGGLRGGLNHGDRGHMGEGGGVHYLGERDCVYLRVEGLGRGMVEGVRGGVRGEVMLGDLGEGVRDG